MEANIIRARAQALISRLQSTQESASNQVPYTHEPTILDTALAATIYRVNSTEEETTAPVGYTRQTALFPESLDYVIERQQPDGGWSYGMKHHETGSILNTLAALLAIEKKMRFEGHKHGNSLKAGPTYTTHGLYLRAQKAKEFLRPRLQDWMPDDAHKQPACAQILQFVLVELAKEGISFYAPGLNDLIATVPSTVNPDSGADSNIESCRKAQVEALSGITWRAQGDTDRPRNPNHLSEVGINRSPALTAISFFISECDDQDIEIYLRNAIKATGTVGGVPPLFPLFYSDMEPILQLLEFVAPKSLGASRENHPRPIATSKEFEETSGPYGKDTEISNANRLKEQKRPHLNSDSLIRSQQLSQTTSSSLDEQCELLKRLVHCADSAANAEAVKESAELVSQMWWSGAWNTTVCISEFYAFSLFTESFMTISNLSTLASIIGEGFLHTRGPIMVLQIIARLLSTQNSNGTWGEEASGCIETTSLALLTLSAVIHLPFVVLLVTDIRQALERGRDVLLLHVLSDHKMASQKNALWMRYTVFHDKYRQEAYALAAAEKMLTFKAPESRPIPFPDKTTHKTFALASFFHALPKLSKESFTMLKIAAIESSFYVRKLKSMRHDIFPRTKAKEMDKYFDYIPIMWTISSFAKRAFVPPFLIWDISVLSMYIFLVDEYMEGQIAEFTSAELQELRTGIERVFDQELEFNPLASHVAQRQDSLSKDVAEALTVFERWARYHMTYSSLTSASPTDLLNLRLESKNYLLHHLTQIIDNQRLAAQSPFTIASPFHAPRMGFAPWLHLVGSGHIGAPIGMVWFAACVGHKLRGAGRDCFSTVKQKLMIWNANSHAGKQLRMFNDYGSVVRDAAERNLNSINFPEFFHYSSSERIQSADPNEMFTSEQKTIDWFEVAQRKQMLLEAAMHERRCTDREMNELYKELKADSIAGRILASWIEVYYAGGDLFSDMYLLRDVTNSIKVSR